MRRQSRVVVLANGSVAAALVAVLAAVALVVKPPAPPGIAEFAPQAAKPITKAPPGQSAAHGTGAGACGAGQTCSTPTPLPRASAVVHGASHDPGKGTPPGLQCYAWGDGKVTQTEDPQSPPCIASWAYEKGNGGATATGVGGTTITVLVPALNTNNAGAAGVRGLFDPQIRALQTFFNRRFQFYGRQLRLVAPSGAEPGCDPSVQQALAAQAAQQRVFAATDIYIPCNTESGWGNALASQHIVYIAHSRTGLTSDQLRRHAPYEWSYTPPADALERHLAEFGCKNLGGDATYAGTALRTTKRSIAFLQPSGSWGKFTIARDALAACQGPRPTLEEYNPAPCGDPTQPKSELQAQMLKLSRDHVTTIVLTGGYWGCAQDAADSVGYQPEWLVYPTVYTSVDELSVGGSTSKTQLSHTFGLMHLDKWLPPNQEPVVQAVASVDGALAAQMMARGPSSDPNSRADSTPAVRSIYEQLLLLASGIQMAGPNLTAQSFADGLEQTEFPNPGAGGKPAYQAHVGFGSGDYEMVDDVGVWWWNTTTTTAAGDPGGGFCYADRGARWVLGHWPSTIRLQQDPCR